MRSGYRKQDDAPIHLRDINDHGNYKATIGASHAKSIGDDGSEDGILPIMNGISKKTEITVNAT